MVKKKMVKKRTCKDLSQEVLNDIGRNARSAGADIGRQIGEMTDPDPEDVDAMRPADYDFDDMQHIYPNMNHEVSQILKQHNVCRSTMNMRKARKKFLNTFNSSKDDAFDDAIPL